MSCKQLIRNFTRVAFFSVVLLVALPGIALAQLAVTSASLAGGTSTLTVQPGASISTTVTATLGPASSTWSSTGWIIATTPPLQSTFSCVNTNNRTATTGSFTTTAFNITAPLAAGTYNAYFFANSANNTSCNGATSSATFTFAGQVIVGPSAANSTVTGSPISVSADGTTTSTITVTLKDGSSNPVAGRTVTLTAGSGSSVISAASGPSNASGVVTFTVTNTVVQSVTYTAKDTTSTNITITQTAAVSFTNSVSAAKSTVVASLATVPANGATTSTITVTLKNGAGTAVSGKTVTLAASSGVSTITTVSGVTNVSGQATFTVSNSTAQTVTYTATDSTDSVVVTQMAAVVFGPSGATSTVAASPTSVAADGSTSSTITVTLKDGLGNVVVGRSVSLSAGSGSSIMTIVSATTNGSGQASFTVKDSVVESVTYTAVDITDITNNILIAQTAAVSFTVTVASFDVVEVTAARATPIYLKLSGTAFTLDVLALNGSNALVTTFAGTVTVELVDAASGGGVCSAMTQLSNQGNLIFAAGTGRKITAGISYANAAVNVKVRIKYASLSITSCSTDAFVIRPTGFSVDSTLNNAPTTKQTAGGAFTITAATGAAAYTGTPQISVSSPISAHAGAVATGTLSGSFAAAIAGTATGASFTYSEVGTFQFATAAVYDSSFAAIDSATGDCISSSSSNTPSGSPGKYGCNIANQAATTQFGRFYPAYFWLDTSGSTAPLLTDRSDLAACFPATTGTIAGASASLSVASSSGFAVGDSVVVKGAGASGADLVTTISAGPPATTFTLAAAASTAATSTRVRKYGFTYMDETLTLSFRMTARNSIGGPPGAITQNYQGATYATLVTGTPVPANFNVGAISGGTDRSSRVSGTLGLSGAWSGGTLDGVLTLSPTRTTAVDGPFSGLDLGINPTDNSSSDNVQINAAQRTLTISATNYAKLDRTDAYFGRLRMQNALGSPLLALTIPIDAQYYSGAVFQRNTADSCTTLTGNNFAVGNYLGTLTSVNTPASNLVVGGVGGKFASGVGSLTLNKPSGGATGSVDISVGLGSTTAAQPCTAPSWSPTVTTAGAKSYLRYQWCGAANDRDPVARATFGAYRNNYIYRRENY